MKRSWFLLSVGVLAGCATLVGPPGTRGEGPVTLTLQPTVVEGGYRTQALVKALTADDVNHVVVSLSKVDGEKVEPVLVSGKPLKADIPARSLSLPVAFKGLTRNTTYRILARAFSAAGEDAGKQISLDESSVIDLVVKEDDRPLFEKRLPIQLRDTPFAGDATGSFAIGNGSIVSGGAESIVSVDVDLPTPEPTPKVFPDGVLAPDDTGSNLEHHDYTVVKNGVSSTFVWIPVFEAYQLIVPGNCGAGNTDSPVGYWVANRPSSGVENVDWARETFGGFYAGKYEASHADAVPGNTTDGSGATEGSSGMLKVAQNCVPWTNVQFGDAQAACKMLAPDSHLMEDDEWTALAVWSMVRGVTVNGNNNQGSDADDEAVTFLPDPFSTSTPLNVGRALTGSGRRSTWSGIVNGTTHTGTSTGVYDLNGNVAEWTGTLGSEREWGRISWADQPGYVTSLSTEANKRRYGVPGSTSSAGRGLAAFGHDRIFTYSDSFNGWFSVATFRGGSSNVGKGAGIWLLSLDYRCLGLDAGIGFRPVLRF